LPFDSGLLLFLENLAVRAVARELMASGWEVYGVVGLSWGGVWDKRRGLFSLTGVIGLDLFLGGSTLVCRSAWGWSHAFGLNSMVSGYKPETMEFRFQFERTL